MTSSDLIELPEDAKQRVAARVGRAFDGPGAGVSSAVRIGLACAEFNGGITDRLLTGALDALEEVGCDLADVIVAWVPGAFELPVVARELARSGNVDAVICLGAVIRGATGHYDFVAGECASGLQRVQLDTGVPVIFGVLTTDTLEQALERSEDDEANKGREGALTALHTVHVLRSVASAAKGQSVGFSAGGR
jgi:6,7-dimethyl-8-ribityllumazine synthase